MKKENAIKEYSLPTKQELHGVLIHPLGSHIEAAHNTLAPHRDDHYQLLFALEGHFHFQIDFEEIKIQAPFFLCVIPEQVHQLINMKQPKGWIVGLERSFLEDEFIHFLDDKKHHVLMLTQDQSAIKQSLEDLLKRAFFLQENEQSIYISRAIFQLINTVLCLLIHGAKKASGYQGRAVKEKRAYLIEQEFIALVQNHYKNWKSPSQYARALSLTTAHLNDSIKEATGKSVTAYLQSYNIMEAKRLLYFTDLEVREVAFSIGYEDPVYFGRLFKKLTGISPLHFRRKFRD